MVSKGKEIEKKGGGGGVPRLVTLGVPRARERVGSDICKNAPLIVVHCPKKENRGNRPLVGCVTLQLTIDSNVRRRRR